MVSAKEESFSFIAFKGQQGFSEFRLKALLEVIKTDFPAINSVACDELYLCSLTTESAAFYKRMEKDLCKILKAKIIIGIFFYFPFGEFTCVGSCANSCR